MVSFALGGGKDSPNPNVDTGISYGQDRDFLYQLMDYEMYGPQGGYSLLWDQPNRNGGAQTTPPPPPGGGGGGGGGGGPRPVTQPAPGGSSGGIQTMSSQPGPTSQAPPHVATQYGFWSDTRGVPGQRATIGANHTVVEFGPDGYVARIVANPGGSQGGTASYNIPFNPYSAGGVTPQTGGTMSPMSSQQPAPTGGAGPITQEQFMSTQPAGQAGYGAEPLGGGGGLSPSMAELPPGGGGGGGGGGPIAPPPAPKPPVDLSGKILPPPGGGTTTPPPGGGATPPPGGGPATPPPATPAPNFYAGGSSGARQLAGQTTFKQLWDTLQNPGYSDAEKSAITQEAMNAARSTYAGARGQIARHSAATGNSMSNNAALASLGRAQAGTMGEQARRNVIDFANEAQKRREWATGGMGQLYGAEGSYLANLFGQRNQAANTPLGTGIRQRKGGEGGTTDYLNPTSPYWHRVGDEQRP